MSPPPATSPARSERDWPTVSISAFNGAMEPAVFFDGRSSRRRVVALGFADRLEITDPGAADGGLLASWPYDAVRRVDGPEGALRLACPSPRPPAPLHLPTSPRQLHAFP